MLVFRGARLVILSFLIIKKSNHNKIKQTKQETGKDKIGFYCFNNSFQQIKHLETVAVLPITLTLPAVYFCRVILQWLQELIYNSAWDMVSDNTDITINLVI